MASYLTSDGRPLASYLTSDATPWFAEQKMSIQFNWTKLPKANPSFSSKNSKHESSFRGIFEDLVDSSPTGQPSKSPKRAYFFFKGHSAPQPNSDGLQPDSDGLLNRLLFFELQRCLMSAQLPLRHWFLRPSPLNFPATRLMCLFLLFTLPPQMVYSVQIWPVWSPFWWNDRQRSWLIVPRNLFGPFPVLDELSRVMSWVQSSELCHECSVSTDTNQKGTPAMRQISIYGSVESTL